MKRKIRAMLLGAAILCLAAPLLLAGCDSVSHTDADHTYVEDTALSVAATCTEPGKKVLRCTGCDATKEEEIPALGHDWEVIETITAPTCGTAGSGTVKCNRCKKEEVGEGVIPATGEHQPEKTYTLDKKPTFNEEGSRSLHCAVCGTPTSVEAVEKLDSAKPFSYEMRLVRVDGTVLPANDFRYEVDLGEEKVASGRFTKGVATLPLAPAEYTVKITNMPNGYTVDESFTTDFETFTNTGKLLLEIPVSAALMEEPAAEDTTYDLNAVLHDAAFTDVRTGTQFSLSGLLAQKKGLILNFFYVECTYCGYEFPQLKRLYEKYGDDIAIVSIDILSKDTDSAIKAMAASSGLNFLFVNNAQGAALVRAFGADTAPDNFFIDCEGVVNGHHDGYIGTEPNSTANEAILEQRIKDLIAMADAKTAKEQAALPSGKRH